MNLPPEEGVRVDASALRLFAAAVMRRLGLTDADAVEVAEALVATDLRGIRSHGTRLLDTYQRQFGARLQPLPGFAPAQLPGGPEWERERVWASDGVPIDAAHREILERVAQELDVPEWETLLGEQVIQSRRDDRA